MRYLLSTGTVVGIKFNYEYRNNKPCKTFCDVEVTKYSDWAELFSKTSKCHPDDQFIKRKGRLCAFREAINFCRTQNILDWNERKELCKLVLPNLLPKKKEKVIIVQELLEKLNEHPTEDFCKSTPWYRRLLQWWSY